MDSSKLPYPHNLIYVGKECYKMMTKIGAAALG